MKSINEYIVGLVKHTKVGELQKKMSEEENSYSSIGGTRKNEAHADR